MTGSCCEHVFCFLCDGGQIGNRLRVVRGLKFSADKPAPHFTAVAQMVGVDLKPIEAEARATIKAQTADEIKALKAQIAPKPKAAPGDTQHAPAAQPSGVAFTQGVTWPKTRKPKTTAAEAKAQIAAAMQSEGGDESGADAPGIEATASGFALAVGARVKVLPSADTGGPAVRLWSGK